MELPENQRMKMPFRDFPPLEQLQQKCSFPAPNTAGILPLSTQTCQNTSVSKPRASTINTANFHAWLGRSPQPDREKPMHAWNQTILDWCREERTGKKGWVSVFQVG